jgi:(p)ppGpp synthase/HD superfamily hydrolase
LLAQPDGPHGADVSHTLRIPPRTLPEADGPDRSARVILALAPGPFLRTAQPTHNVGVPHKNDSTPVLTRRITAAFGLAYLVHGQQLRKKTGIPYLAHVMSVSALALEHGADEDVAIAALLHDSVEDSENGAATLGLVKQEFGMRVARIVLACSDAVAVPGKPKPEWRERKETYLHHLDADADGDVLLVSACDKVHNAGAILDDLRLEGNVVWKRFTVSDPSEQLWYYTTVTEILQRRLPGPLTDRLGEIVEQIAAFVA